MKPPDAIPESLDTLTRLWRERDLETWRPRADLYLGFGRRAVTLGQPALGVDILSEGLTYFPEHGEMAYGATLALVNCGSLRQAQSRIDTLLGYITAEHPLYSEILSLAGRLAKDRWSKVPDSQEGKRALEEAAVLYLKAYHVSRDYFPGINAASMNVLGGHEEQGQEIAREVRDQCARMQERESNHWVAATLGEAYLLLGDDKASASWYRKAAASAGDRIGDIASMRRQVHYLAKVRQTGGSALEALSIPKVALFVGHMIDQPGRKRARFPERLVPEVEIALGRSIDQRKIGIGYTSLACGADILFAEQMIRRGHELNIILPFDKSDFIQTSVAFAGKLWIQRFESVLRAATHVSFGVKEGYLGDPILFSYTARLLEGAAILRGRQLVQDPVMVAVVDGDSENLTGGAMASLRSWEAQKGDTEVIDLAIIRESSRPPAVSSISGVPDNPLVPKRDDQIWAKRRIHTMLFADMVGFSRLTETAAPSFIVNFLGEIAKIIHAGTSQPIFRNTWGDGLFLVFDEVEHAADFALRLRDAISRFDWAGAGLPQETNIRIGIHTGPVFPAPDPIIRRENFFGSHVNRAARIEPVTVAGAVYISEQTAVLLAASGKREFAYDYLGEKMLAKKYGANALYRLRRANEID
ncbi:MAG: DUF4071 domain-containing protein, partial [Gammaproteobacteria bacterium]|nr:DUF4071 domain-containing protein [Gammaproteobacteria bacterium]